MSPPTNWSMPSVLLVQIDLDLAEGLPGADRDLHMQNCRANADLGMLEG